MVSRPSRSRFPEAAARPPARAITSRVATSWPLLRRRLGCRAAAAILSVAAIVALLTITAESPALAGRLVSESNVIEWLQVVLAAGAGLLAFRQARAARRAGQPAVLDVAIVAAMVVICIGEVDLDRILFGTKVISTRFFVNPNHSVPVRALAVILVVGAPVAFGVWLLVHIRDLWSAGMDALRQPWGQSAALGMVLFMAVEAFERPLNHLGSLPPYFAEEVLELVSMVFVSAGLVARSRELKLLSVRSSMSWPAHSAACPERRGRGNSEIDKAAAATVLGTTSAHGDKIALVSFASSPEAGVAQRQSN